MEEIYRHNLVRTQEREKFDDLLVTYLELNCDLFSEELIVEELKSRHYPIEKCIEVVEERKKNLPLAYLLMRNGLFKPAITLYMEVLKETKIKSSDFLTGVPDFSVTDGSSSSKNVRAFDNILTESFTICELSHKQLTEDEQVGIWFTLIETLYTLRQQKEEHLTRKQKTDDLLDFDLFYKNRISAFITEMSSKINLTIIIERLVLLNPDLSYSEISAPFEHMMDSKFYQRNIMNAASKASGRSYVDVHETSLRMKSEGLSLKVNKEKCGISQKYFSKLRTNKKNTSEYANINTEGSSIVLFTCGHSFYEKCLKIWTADNEPIQQSRRKSSFSTSSTLSNTSMEGSEDYMCPTCLSKVTKYDILPSKRVFGKKSKAKKRKKADSTSSRSS